MKATVLMNRQEGRERERERSSEEERERQEGERTGGRGTKLTTRARRCVLEGINTKVYPGTFNSPPLIIPVGSLHTPLSTSVERVPCLEGNNRRIRVRFL